MSKSGMDAMCRYLRSSLSFERYRHCLGVMVAMERAAATYGLNMLKASQAGLLHDAAKELPDKKLMAMLSEHDPEELEALKRAGCLHNVYLHGPAAVPLVRLEFNITDQEVLDAIRQHVGNYEGMSTLARCLHVADMTAPTEAYPGARKLRLLFNEGRLDEAELLLDVWILDNNSRRGIPIHPWYHRRIQELTEIVSPGPGFFSRNDPLVS